MTIADRAGADRRQAGADAAGILEELEHLSFKQSAEKTRMAGTKPGHDEKRIVFKQA
jgi:hypothetical protein